MQNALRLPGLIGAIERRPVTDARHKNNSVYEPDSRSALAFAYRILGALDTAFEATGNCTAAQLQELAVEAAREGNTALARCCRYYARCAEPIDDVWRSYARDEMFPPPERPSSTADEVRVDKYATLLRGGDGMLKALAKFRNPKKARPCVSGRPSKATVRTAFIGCHYSPRDGKFSSERTALSLSEGIPASVDSGIDHDPVDYQLRIFVRDLCRSAPPGMTIADAAKVYCRYYVLCWRRVEYLWSHLGARRRSPAAVAELIESGMVFELLDAFEDSDAFSGPAQSAVKHLLGRMIAELQRMRGRLQKCA